MLCRFFQTPPRGDALAVRYPSPPSGWERTFTPKDLVLNNFPISRVLDIVTPPVIPFLEGGMESYSPDVEAKMTKLFAWLSEKDRRRYAAIEAAKLGHGGVDYVARLRL